jgi:hypothetical protein
MKASAFAYARVTGVANALELLLVHEEKARVLSGEQSPNPALNLQLFVPEVIVDIGELAELRGVAIKGETLIGTPPPAGQSPEFIRHCEMCAAARGGLDARSAAHALQLTRDAAGKTKYTQTKKQLPKGEHSNVEEGLQAKIDFPPSPAGDRGRGVCCFAARRQPRAGAAGADQDRHEHAANRWSCGWRQGVAPRHRDLA